MKYEKMEDIRWVESIRSYVGPQLKAPENFTETVMNAIYRMKDTEEDAADIRIGISRLCKNLGTSLILASVVMMISFFIPRASVYPSYLQIELQNDNAMQQTSVIKDNLSGMNDNIGSIFESIHRSVARFKEGT